MIFAIEYNTFDNTIVCNLFTPNGSHVFAITLAELPVVALTMMEIQLQEQDA